MKKNELLQDDWLADLMKDSGIEAPSGEFLEHVMKGIESMPSPRQKKGVVILFVKAVLPWILFACVMILFFFISDLPLGDYFPGKDYLQTYLGPLLESLFTSVREIVSTKFFSISLTILLSGGIIIGIERLISHRRSMHHHYLL